jgi:hypothetical protein
MAMVVYKVQAGDTPMLIAKRFTGDPDRFGELIAANRWKIKVVRQGVTTFFNLRAGELLRVPLAWRTPVNVTAMVGLGDIGDCVSDSDCTDPNNPSCNLVTGECGPPATCSAPAGADDDSIITAATNCGAAYAQVAEHQITLSVIWQDALNGAAQGTKYGLAAAGAIVVVTEMIEQLGSDVAMAIIENLLLDIGINVSATIASAAGAGVALGSELGPIGAVIGIIVGIIVGILEIVFSSCNIEVTNGTTNSCSGYQAQVQDAISWLQENQNNLAGVTPVQLANQFGLFLANPVWLSANQNLLGITQPPPPSQSSDQGQIYYNLPGAFEMLNKVQLAAAAQLFVSAPGKIPFWMTIPNPGTQVPVQDPTQYQAISNQVQQWALGEVSYNTSTTQPQNIYPACPGLMVGTSTQAPFNAPSPGLYTLQMLFPALTQTQCENIFASPNGQALYTKNLNGAKEWAMTQCTDPTAGLGTGSRWNLEQQDIEPIVAEWQAANVAGSAACQLANAASTAASDVSAAVASVATNVASGAAVLGGAAAIGVAAYAVTTGVSVPAAARTAWSGVTGLVRRGVRLARL